MTCLTTNEVVGFLAGHLAAAELAAVERHLDECAACRILVTELARVEAEDDGADPLPAEEAALATTAPLGVRAASPSAERPAPEAATTPGPGEVALPQVRTLGGHRVVGEVPGRYQVRDELRRGGQARILLAFDTFMGREVALKELSLSRPDAPPSAPGAEDTAARTRRFLREARITAQLTHPAIVQVFEVGRRADGALYYSMPVVRGRTLAEAIAACPDLGARLRLLGHFETLCQGVAYAHSQGFIHRDIKPENVMIGAFGETILLDWGLAKHLGRPEDPEPRRRESLAEEALTAAGMTVGTPAYMSPEQAAGQLGEVDERSDVWGLGTVLYTLLTGQVPFKGDSTAQLVERVLTARFAPILTLCPEAPPALAALAEHALARDREARPQSVRAVLEALTAARAEAERTPGRPGAEGAPAPGSLGPPDPQAGRASVGGRSRPTVALLAAVAVLALVGLGASLRWLHGERRARTRAAEAEKAARREAVQAQAERAALAKELALAHASRAEAALARRDLKSAKVYAAAALATLAHLPAPPQAIRERAFQAYARATRPGARAHPLRGDAVAVPPELRQADPRHLLSKAEREAGFTVATDLAHTGGVTGRRP